MSRMMKKGIATALFAGLLAAPVAAAAPSGERAERNQAPAVAGWFAELVERVGGWLLGSGDYEVGSRTATPETTDTGQVSSVSGNDEAGAGQDPNG